MTARSTLLTSFLVTSSVGVMFIVVYWLHDGFARRAATNAALFVAAMAIVHLGGYRVWQSQPAVPPAPRSSLRSDLARARMNVGVLGFGLFLFAAGIQFNKYQEMKRLAAEQEAAGKPFAPTMVTEPAGWAVALLCFGLISLIAGLKKPTPTKSADGASK